MGEGQGQRVFHTHSFGKRLDGLLWIQRKCTKIPLVIFFAPPGIGGRNDIFHLIEGQPFVKAITVQHHADSIFYLLGLFPHIHAQKADLAAVRPGQTQKRMERGRFPCAVGSDKAGDTALRQRKRNVLQSKIFVRFIQMMYLQNRM